MSDKEKKSPAQPSKRDSQQNQLNEGAVVMITLPETIKLYECEDAGNVVSSATALLKQASEELHEIIARMNKAGVDSFAELADGEGK